MIAATIQVVLVAIVTDFARIHTTIATSLSSTAPIATIAIDFITVVTGLKSCIVDL